MAIPKLKGFDCVDHDPIEEWRPDSDEEVYYSLCLHIGPSDEEGSHLFYVDVVTPATIERLNLAEPKFKRRIIVSQYSWTNVIKEVQAVLDECTGDDWATQSEFLAKYFNWEFENYQPYAP